MIAAVPYEAVAVSGGLAAGVVVSLLLLALASHLDGKRPRAVGLVQMAGALVAGQVFWTIVLMLVMT